MKILITGGTGLIGRALCKSLNQKGHTLTVISRQPATVKDKCGLAVHALSSLDEWQSDDHYDAVVNLAGEPIVGLRWTVKRKKVLWDSRVSLTEKLVQKILRASSRPSVLVSGSAVGIYGDCGNQEVDENSKPASDFGARLCSAWEQEALKAEAENVRTCLIRTGLVLSNDGGMLKQLILPFRLGLGTRIGDGKQWMSWVHIEDQIAIIEKLLTDTSCRGAFNLCTSRPVTNKTFTQCLARTVNRPVFLFAPASVIRPLLGESASLLLGGQKVLPYKLDMTDYRFRYPDLESALEQLVA
jgi:uncharacterized protein (TIGR01777 family)